MQPTGLIVTAWHLEGLEVDWPTEMLVYDRAAPRRARRSPSHSDGGHFVWRERDRAWSVDNLKPAGPAVRGARRNEPTCTAELQQRWRLFQRLLVRNERRSWPGASPRANDAERALRWNIIAGDEAQLVFAHSEAEQYYRPATRVARELGDVFRELQVQEKLGRVLWLMARYQEALQALELAAKAYREQYDFRMRDPGDVRDRLGAVGAGPA